RPHRQHRLRSPSLPRRGHLGSLPARRLFRRGSDARRRAGATLRRVAEEARQERLPRRIRRARHSEPLLVAMNNLLAYLNENCIPSAYWAGGPGWGDYVMAIEPRDGEDRPQMRVLQQNLNNDCAEYGPHS